MDNKRICRYCGAELMPNTNFCVKCGENNDDKPAAVSSAGAGISKSGRKARKTVFAVVFLFLLSAAAAGVLAVMPVAPKGTYASGNYDKCISVSFSAAKILPIGRDVEIYISEDGDGYRLYDGEEYDLNQVRTYTFDLYTVNGAGIKSAEKQYEYTMTVDQPAALEVSVKPGTYTDYQEVEIKSDDSSVIYYSTDGSFPSENSDVYDAAIQLGQGTTVIRAFAVNREGTAGDVYEWEYELNLPVPADVSYSPAGGTYEQELELVLASDKDVDIYYTTDGSKPTAQSKRYKKPITLETGIYTFKAVAENGYHMSSGVTKAHYAVTLPKFGRFQRTAAADRYYGIIGGDCELVSFNARLEEKKRYGIYNVASVYSDGADLYYLADNALYRLDQADGSGKKIIDMYIDNFVLLNDKIYLESSDILYSIDLDGNDLKKYKEFHACTIMGCWDHQLYIWDNGTIYKIDPKEGEPQKAGEADSSRCFIRKDKLYYIDDDSNLVCKNMQDGSASKMIESDSEYYNLDPDFELLNTTDKSEIITTSYEDIFVCNNTLYVLERTDDEYVVYYILTEATEREVTTSYRWYAVDLDTENVWDTSITTDTVTVFDNVIIDGNENRSQVIQ